MVDYNKYPFDMWSFHTFSNWLYHKTHRRLRHVPDDETLRRAGTPALRTGLPTYEPSVAAYLYKQNEPRERLTVVLDLDETLVHSQCLYPDSDDSHQAFDAIVWDEHHTCRFGVVVRPMTHDLLQYGAKHFDLVLFTTAERAYARPVMAIVDPMGLIRHRFYRDSCITAEDGIMAKPLQYLGRSMARLVLVDNSTASMRTAPDNGLPFSSFVGDTTADASIRHLLNLLTHLDAFQDVRPFLIHTFKVRERLHDADLGPLDEEDFPFAKTPHHPHVEISNPLPVSV